MTSEFLLSQQTQESERGFKILISTDNHLGYKERHPIRGNDSFEALEEVLKKACENKVDMIVLGGDLFHEMNPSQESMYKCIQIFRKYIFGSREIKYDCYWDSNAPNFFNENINIELPIFIIHGNHDMPSSEYGNLSVLDLLHVGNYVNYYGKTRNYDELEVVPILFHKGDIKIALYGIGYIKDIRLHQILDSKKFKFRKPENFKEYFNILVIHQNSYKGKMGADYKNCIHPKMLPSFINLVIWGHEHESIDEIFQNEETGHYIYQPGSSVMTSLIEAEGKMKHAGLINITKGNFTLNTLYLTESHRTLLYSQLELSNLLEKKKIKFGDARLKEDIANEELAEEILDEEIKRLLNEHERDQNRINDKLPLIRVKVEYTGFDILRIQRIEAKYKGKVANEGEILRFWKRKPKKSLEHIIKNEKLQESFVKTLENKSRFNTLGQESLAEINTLYHQNVIKEAFDITPSTVIFKKFDFVEEEELDNRNFRNRQTIIEETLNNISNSTKKSASKEYFLRDLNILQKDFLSFTSSMLRDIKKISTARELRDRPGSNKFNPPSEENQAPKRWNTDYEREAPPIYNKINLKATALKVIETLYPELESNVQNMLEPEKIKQEEEIEVKSENAETIPPRKVIRGAARNKKEDVIVLSDSSAYNEPQKTKNKPGQKHNQKHDGKAPRGVNKKCDKKCGSSDEEPIDDSFFNENKKKRVFNKDIEVKEENTSDIDEFAFSRSKKVASSKEREIDMLKKKAIVEQKQQPEARSTKKLSEQEKPANQSQSQIQKFFTKNNSSNSKLKEDARNVSKKGLDSGKEEVFFTMNSEEAEGNRKKFIKKSTEKSNYNPMDILDSDEEVDANLAQLTEKTKNININRKEPQKGFNKFINQKNQQSLLSPLNRDSDRKRKPSIQEIDDGDSDDMLPNLNVGKKKAGVLDSRKGISPGSVGKRSSVKEGFL